MLIVIFSLSALGLTLGSLLGLASHFLKVESDPLIDEIEAMLPGSQCGQCGYAGCGPAASAIATGEALVTICPPGGKPLAQSLGDKMGVEVDLDAVEDKAPVFAQIKEDLCTGCTKCMKRCPTDAIWMTTEEGLKKKDQDSRMAVLYEKNKDELYTKEGMK